MLRLINELGIATRLHGDEGGHSSAYEEIKDEYEKARSKRPAVRFVDFNQGMDARLATSEKHVETLFNFDTSAPNCV